MALVAGEVERIAELLGLDLHAMTARYTRLLADRSGLSLVERADGACVFLQADNSCRIQAAKPLQCRGFPHTWRSERLVAGCPALQGVACSGEPPVPTVC